MATEAQSKKNTAAQYRFFFFKENLIARIGGFGVGWERFWVWAWWFWGVVLGIVGPGDTGFLFSEDVLTVSYTVSGSDRLRAPSPSVVRKPGNSSTSSRHSLTSNVQSCQCTDKYVKVVVPPIITQANPILRVCIAVNSSSVVYQGLAESTIK